MGTGLSSRMTTALRRTGRSAPPPEPLPSFLALLRSSLQPFSPHTEMLSPFPDILRALQPGGLAGGGQQRCLEPGQLLGHCRQH